MLNFPPTTILRHKRENLHKCSLKGLEQRPDFIFLTYPSSTLPCLDQMCILTLNAPILSAEDAHLGLFLIDGTWRYTKRMLKTIPDTSSDTGRQVHRSLPFHFQTAYPRRQLDCPDPTRGLASIEAIYLAYMMLGRSTEGLLDHYYWREDFLKINSAFLSR